MRVLMQNRSNFNTAIAGDSVQLRKTGEYLERLGVEVKIHSGSGIDLKGFDLVHLFNLIPVADTYRQFENARRQGKAIVLSPIFWDPAEYLEISRQSGFEAWWRGTMPLRRLILAGSSMILPNSQLELDALRRHFPTLPPAVVIPNAADRSFAAASPEWFIKRYQISGFLLTAGRICRRKNQLSLIRVAKMLNQQLVIIGPVNDGPYYLQCRKESAGGRVLFIDSLGQQELASAYAAARVHALVSWYDTPGLVSLEAALAGCRIVSTDRGSAKEYFGSLAEYCDPGDEASILQAVNRAWERPPESRLRELVLQKYTWEQAAQATLAAYQNLLGN
ncbi:MAG: glycosyltransferase family 4 protein [Firmicutes bacterium]|nr:glycosyltransferase family 4 protein [Bacillota bacterium]